MKGYIKLNRKIIDHWLWLNPKQLRAWIYLLCEAAWEPKTIPVSSESEILVGRGQICTTIRKLMGEFGYYADATIKFLDLLEKQNMIVRKSTSKFTLITIVNFEKYQNFEEDQERKSERKSEHIKINKEEKNKRNINISLSTREKELKFFEELFAQEIFFNNISASLSVEPEKVKDYAEQFKSEMLIQEKYHKSFQDLRQHFFNWLKKLLKSINQENSNQNGNNFERLSKANDKLKPRRGTDAGSHSPDDYGGAF